MPQCSNSKQKPLPVPPEHEPHSPRDTIEKLQATQKPWRPVTLRKAYLAALIAATIGLIIMIQYLSFISGRDQGILFAQDVNDLPLRRSFAYLYLPTMISVTYSFLWTWVDLDIKRLEPYFQMSKPGGEKGSSSILLSYPLEFLVTLPLLAFKRRHWSVLTGSAIMILVFWGLTPTQSGIFAVRSITIVEDMQGSYSSSFIPSSQQGNLTADYAQSVYNIAWLNETLPPYMARDSMLSPFTPYDQTPSYSNIANFTGETKLYSIDLQCESATLWNSSGTMHYNSSQGCSFYAPTIRPEGGNDTSKPYDSLYVGYQNQNGLASYYLSSECDERFSHYFFIRWSRSTKAAIEGRQQPGNEDIANANATSLFCHATYFQQMANATIDLPSYEVLDVRPFGAKSALPDSLFNISTFEWAMSSGQEEFPTRADFPTTGFPDQKPQLANLPLNLAYLPQMAPFAIATYRRPLDENLDPEVLRLSYQSAYRLLFARQLSDILTDQRNALTYAPGQRKVSTQAVVVVPAFAYAATVLLVIILGLATGLLLTVAKRPNLLKTDPATIGNLMDLVCNDPETTETLATLNKCGADALSKSLKDLTFTLESPHDHSDGIQLRTHNVDTGDQDGHSSHSNANLAQDQDVPGVRPTEMRLIIGTIFLILQVAALVIFNVLYYRAKTNYGLPLPSSSTFLRQLVENYIPIMFATFVEPFWLVLNRLLCLLQPFEELRKGNAAASRSTDLDYSSLPPQLLFLRAFRARHFVLTLVCFMVLLANVLAVALSGLMYEGSMMVPTNSNFSQVYSARFRDLNGTGLPFNTNSSQNSQGGTTSGQFYREMSNLTAGTPLPAWTDEQYAYLPASIANLTAAAQARLTTTAFGADLECQSLGAQNYTLNFTKDGRSAALATHLSDSSGSLLKCTNFQQWTDDDLNGLQDPQTGHVALELGSMLTTNSSKRDDLFCRQHLLFTWMRVDWELVKGKVGAGPGLHYYDEREMKITSRNETMILCKPKLRIGPAEIVVNSHGQVQDLISNQTNTDDLSQYFASKPEDVIAQANQFLADTGVTWHKDSYPSDFINYLIEESTHDNSLLDPASPVPSAEHASQQLTAVYRNLFAILISTNFDLLFEKADNRIKLHGTALNSETRILFSTPAFIVTITILACYIITTIFLYARRPWRILPRLPSTVASNIAFFAGSRALRELSTTEPEDRQKVRSEWTWSYGTFVDLNGQEHIGIEREPFVRTLPNVRNRLRR